MQNQRVISELFFIMIDIERALKLQHRYYVKELRPIFGFVALLSFFRVRDDFWLPHERTPPYC